MNRGLNVLAGILLILTALGCSDSENQLLKSLESDNSAERLRAARKLTIQKKSPELIRQLIGLLDSKDERTVFIATQILGASDSSAVKPLSRLINHPNPAIRERAVQSLGLIGYKDAAPYLVEALHDSSAAVRYMAVDMLGVIDNPSVIPSLYPMLRDEADSVRAMTVQSLYMYHKNNEADVRAADFAIAMRDMSEQVRWVAVQALGESYPDSTVAGELLVEALKDPNKYIRIKAIQGIAKIGYKPAVPALKGMYDLATVEEEMEITDAIKLLTGEEYPPPGAY